jgi:LysM repeat protein
MGNIINISVGIDGTAVCVDKNQNVWMRAARMANWTPFNDAKGVKASCARQDHLWLLNANGDIFQRQGNAWAAQQLGAKFMDVATGADGTVWAVGTDQILWVRTHVNPVWSRDLQGRGVQISVAKRDQVWIVAANGDLYQLVNNAWTLRKRGAAATYVSVGSDGSVWYLGPGSQLFRPQGADWVADTTTNQRGVQISVRNAAEVWMLNLAGDLWQMVNNRWTPVTTPGTTTPPLTGGGGAQNPGTGTNLPARLYKIQAGDTLSALSQRFGVTMPNLLKANPQIRNANVLKVGEVLNVPAIVNALRLYSVLAGDTMATIAQKFNVDYAKLVQANPHIPNPNFVNTGDAVFIP